MHVHGPSGLESCYTPSKKYFLYKPTSSNYYELAHLLAVASWAILPHATTAITQI